MPATAGRASMPPNNRLSVSDSLKTHDVWQQAVGYDPYAGKDEGAQAAIPEVGEINSSARGLFRLAQLTGNSSTLAPGACKKCGQVGHLFFQCRNNLTQKKPDHVSDEEDDDPPSDQVETSSDDDDDDDSSSDLDSESSDSDDDAESDSSSDKKKKKSKKGKKSSKKDKKRASEKSKKKKRKKEKEKEKKKKKKKKDKDKDKDKDKKRKRKS
eukprot:TRINITY_DN6263_c3_g1_i1.p1 TRINITY_DN6263_c3_g1~~TRINITY_DN6263_c3_g1_i1.p1  ORF type:complete len:212 (+),score=61.75 TRINITY_DN6263_c3_g1_i1:160-795(+)